MKSDETRGAVQRGSCGFISSAGETEGTWAQVHSSPCCCARVAGASCQRGVLGRADILRVVV